jgi:oxygen-dependent protoporphyrinogen oxidase
MGQPRRVIVIGAGISGLSVAWWLHRAGMSVTILERDSLPGGTMRTVHDGEWLVETGPNSALETTPLFGEMFEALGIAGKRCYAYESSGNRYILRDGHLNALPMSPGAFLTSRLWSVGGKLRLLKEPFIGRSVEEETIAQFVERRLGREFLDYAINPFVAGVYAGNPEQLSVRAAFPKLYALEEKYGGLIKGMLRGAKERKQRAETAKDRAKMFSFLQGMQTFPDAIGRELTGAVQLNCEVRSITRSGAKPGTNDGAESDFVVSYQSDGGMRQLGAEFLVLAVPSYHASRLVHDFSLRLATLLDEVYYPPVAEVFLGFRTDQCGIPLNGFGYLVPEKEGRKILGTIWSSSLFPHRAPKDHIALTTFVGGSRQPELAALDHEALVQMVVSELRSIMAITGDPVFAKTMRWDKAIPQYSLGYHKLYEEIDSLESSNPGLFICSNYRGGIAVGDCVMNARRIADRVLQAASELPEGERAGVRVVH